MFTLNALPQTKGNMIPGKNSELRAILEKAKKRAEMSEVEKAEKAVKRCITSCSMPPDRANQPQVSSKAQRSSSARVMLAYIMP